MASMTHEALNQSAIVFECLHQAVIEMMTPETDFTAMAGIMETLRGVAVEYGDVVPLEMTFEFAGRRVTFAGTLDVEIVP